MPSPDRRPFTVQEANRQSLSPEINREPAHIATASYYPTGGIIDNAMIELMKIRTSSEGKPFTAESIMKTTGIEERYVTASYETPLYMAERVAEQLLNDYGAPDVVLVSTSYPTGVNISKEIIDKFKLGDIYHMDIHAACSGFAVGLELLHKNPDFFLGKKVLTIATEDYGPHLEPIDLDVDKEERTDPSIGASLFSAGSHGKQFVFGEDLITLGSNRVRLPYAESTALRMGINYELMVPPYIAEPIPAPIGKYFEQDGSGVMKRVVRYIPGLIYGSMKDAGLLVPNGRKVDLVVGHQPSRRVGVNLDEEMNKALSILGEPPLEFYHDFREGNASSGSIPKATAKAIQEGKIFRGAVVAHPGYGAGFMGVCPVVEYL